MPSFLKGYWLRGDIEKFYPCHRLRHIKSKLLNSLPNGDWDAVVLNKCNEKILIKYKRYDVNNLYMVKRRSYNKRGIIRILYLNFLAFKRLNTNTPDFMGFLVPVVISIIIAIIIDRIIAAVYNMDR